MDSAQSLSHTKWDCKYHVAWIPKCRQKVLYGKLRQHLGALLKDLARQQGCEILEGHLRPDHIHILISIPPKYAVSKVMGFIKGKSAIVDCPNIPWQAQKLLRSKLLGQGILCEHRRGG